MAVIIIIIRRLPGLDQYFFDHMMRWKEARIRHSWCTDFSTRRMIKILLMFQGINLTNHQKEKRNRSHMIQSVIKKIRFPIKIQPRIPLCTRFNVFSENYALVRVNEDQTIGLESEMNPFLLTDATAHRQCNNSLNLILMCLWTNIILSPYPLVKLWASEFAARLLLNVHERTGTWTWPPLSIHSQHNLRISCFG